MSNSAQSKAILNALPANIALLDAQGRITSVNEAWQRFAGANGFAGSGYGVGLDYLDVCDRAQDGAASEAHQVAEGIRAVLGGRAKTYSVEYACHSATEQRWFLMTVTPTAEATPSGAVVMHLDVTARRLSNDRLQASELLLRQMAESISDAFFLRDANSPRIHYISRAYEEIWGRTRESLYADPESWTAAIHPEDRASVQEQLAEGRSTGKFEFEYRIMRPDGTMRWIETRGFPVPDPDNVTRIAGVAKDITERKQGERVLRRAEQAQAASEVRYRRLFEAANDGILILDAGTGKIVEVNPFLVELTGYPYEDFLGRQLWEIGPFKDAVTSVASFPDLQAKAYVRYEDLPLQARDGRKIDVEFISNVYRVDGKDVIQCNIRDISARKRADQQRQTLEEQLRLSQRMEAIGSLAGGVAHDFNNLLSVILSYTECAIDSVRQGDPLRDDLLEVKKAAEHAATLTRQLLAFSRKQVLQPVPLDLNQIATEIEKLLRRVLGADIDFIQVLAPDLGVVRADPGQIEQVLMNLAVNARDAMTEGGKLTIETSNVELDEEYTARHVAVKPGAYVLLTVSDTGCGMDQRTKARLFEPFFTTKEKGRGTGLGLSTVYGIVTQSGGNIWVYSEPGHGTSFKIYLPRDLSVTRAPALKRSFASVPITGIETILVVEDEEMLRVVAQRSLSARGYTVLTAADGDAALDVSRRHAGDVHLLLTDVVMPRMGGRALAEALGKERPTLKVLYMSGYTDDSIVHHGVLDAGTHFLAKPFTAAGLARKVREVLDGGITGLAQGYEQAGHSGAGAEDLPLDRDAVRALPAEMLHRLRRAVTAARYDDVVELVETIRPTAPEVATGLRRMADLFDGDGLQNLLSPGQEERSRG